MFEDFSFLSASSTISANRLYAQPSLDPLENERATLSPSSSRCSSPQSHRRTRDGRFDSRASSLDSMSDQPRRPSIDTLTNQFDNHSPFDAPTIEYQPRSTPVPEDEGFDEPASNHANYSSCDCSSSYSSSLPALTYTLSSLSHTPASSTRLPMAFAARRRQRQFLSRLQCVTSGSSTLESQLAMLVEEYHPSSLPLKSMESEPEDPASSGPRQRSITSAGYSVIASSPALHSRRSAIVKRPPRVRKRK